jgi:hypothetical protein
VQAQLSIDLFGEDALENGKHPHVRRPVVRQHGDRLAAHPDTLVQLDPLLTT